MEKLKHILKLNENDLKNFLYNHLNRIDMKPIIEDGFIYAEGDIPILLVAHMDTVFYEPPKSLYYVKKSDILFSFEGGIGGDDRCGVYAILKILEDFKPHVLFTEEEEMGGIGATKAVKKLKRPNVKYIIEFDRRGNNDCVFYECGNEEFVKYIESFGFETDYGSFSDISILGSEWDIAAVNLSSGYYNEHTDDEYIKFNELLNNINRVKLMLKKHKDVQFFDYKEIIYPEQAEKLFSNSYLLEKYNLFFNKFKSIDDESAYQDNDKKVLLKKKVDK